MFYCDHHLVHKYVLAYMVIHGVFFLRECVLDLPNLCDFINIFTLLALEIKAVSGELKTYFRFILFHIIAMHIFILLFTVSLNDLI